ncbi:hypothetical protein RJ639_042727 [Escallonia herrerae]|uniref:Integrase catalytic domain-containing protein n=1 Tax=Escallonia herrerae TaxID=1293975 RepID=A0AA89B3N5_9ASTE|nr:hypothetical protein RJ639_042727 [Escallonia herrerae]
MAVVPPPTYHSHLDPGDLRLRLTSRSSFGRKYQSTADPTYNHKDKSRDHVTRSGSCYRRDSSVEDSTNSSPAQAARVKTPRRPIHRKRTPEPRSQERDSWKVVPRYHSPERSRPRNESGYPLSKAIEKAKLPPNFRMPQCDLYDGTGDPGEHVSDAVMCRAFPTTLRKAAHAWFKSIQPRSIHSFSQLSDLFQKHFVSSRSRRKNSASLLNIVQEKNESLACFLGRFNAATLEIDNLDESVKYTAFLRGLRPTSKFAFSVNKSPPGNMKALLEKANKYIQAEEYLETHRERRGEGKLEQKKRPREITPPEGRSAKRPKHDERRPKDTFNLTPLNARPSQILHEIKDNKALQWPDRMKSRPNKRNKDLWCHFHNDHGHTTDNCGSLKRAIEALIKRGQLRRFVAPKEDKQQTPPAIEEREDREENAGIINTISGGIAAGGSSGKARKAYAREVCVTSQPRNKKLKTVPTAMITFSDDDSKGIKTPHDDPLVVTIKAGNFDVKRVLIDNGSSAEILFHDAFEKMNIPTDRLRKMEAPLYGFSNHPVATEGIIALPVAIGTPPTQANLMLDFVVVKIPSAYNAILGRPALNRLQAIVSTYHLKMKFPTEHGIGEVKGDQTTARQCYATSCRSKNKEALIIEDLREDTKMQRGEPVEDLVSIEVYPGEKDKTVRIGSNLKEVTKLELVKLLRTYADIFAWTAADMPGIDPEIITHRLKRSFEELKTHLSSPPLLSKPFPGEDLLIYLSVTEVAVSTVLIREENGIQKPIYYVSKVLQDVETRYPKIDKIALALIISARRLRPYFQSHTIIVLTDQPLRKVLMSPGASGRLVNWSVELGEFDLQYKPRTAVKAQALADFIVECTLPEDPPQLMISEVTDPWNLYVDGSSAVGNSGAGIILISPEGILYKKSFSLPYLRCLRPSESLYALQEVHERICGQHLGGRTLAQKILRQGYYWPTMQKDAIEFTRRCDQCQKFAPLSHTPVAPLTSIVSPIPFAVWGMDLLGPFPMASGQRRFVIVAIDYFTKWTEAESLATITSAKCEDFFWKNIICRFGVPRALIVDNGKQFDNSKFRTFCSNLSIDLRFTSVAHPQSNGQTENMNRGILQRLKKKLNEAKGA